MLYGTNQNPGERSRHAVPVAFLRPAVEGATVDWPARGERLRGPGRGLSPTPGPVARKQTGAKRLIKATGATGFGRPLPLFLLLRLALARPKRIPDHRAAVFCLIMRRKLSTRARRGNSRSQIGLLRDRRTRTMEAA